ncbi:MAG: hypothetical protein K2Y22_06215 [Candidatus Obscuribacterales bacterium]|nr:hypothetical protein [Candidatus Obscuribacterales bacterium]
MSKKDKQDSTKKQEELIPQFRPSHSTGSYCARRDGNGNSCSMPIMQHYNGYGRPSHQSCSGGH